VQDKIAILGAREHNLKDITVEIPRDRLVVITGISGSGKSSLAFDTLYAEGQRRYVESLSAYARQFLGQMEKPDVDQIEGLSPTIAIDQRGASRNPRSTVGTVTEIYDYLRLLYARIGVPHCPQCGRQVTRQSAQRIVEAVMEMTPGARFQVLAPLVRDRKGHHRHLFEEMRKAGLVRVRVDGRVHDVGAEIALDRYKAHTIEAVVDRLVIPQEQGDRFRSRLTDSVETALRLGNGVTVVSDLSADPPQDQFYSEHLACPACGISLPELEPRLFSFNTPHGACPACQGLGTRMKVDLALLVPDPNRSIEGFVFQPRYLHHWEAIWAVCKHYDIPMDVPWRELSDAQQQVILYGTGDEQVRVKGVLTFYEGVIPNLERQVRETDSQWTRERNGQVMRDQTCPDCGGRRLRPEALGVTVAGRSIVEVTTWPVSTIQAWVDGLALSEQEWAIARRIVEGVRDRLRFLADVGLDYLTLDRTADTLAGGEAQRIRLATQIGSRLMGVLYILDEPSIGLHPRDNARLLRTLQEMRDLGNTVIVVEHDEATVRAADWIVDLGPGAGERGGEVVVAGTVEEVMACPESVTGAYLSGRKAIPIPARRRAGSGGQLIIRGAREHNLKDIDVAIPLGKLVCITGVSGSGKSTLLIDVLYRRLAQVLHGSQEQGGDHDAIEGIAQVDKVVNVDQSPIGRTPRSNPATYANLFTPIRELYAALPESKVRGYQAGRFSFNVKGGRCETCQGYGTLRIEMQFLPDVYVPCDACHGKRYNRETLQVRYKGKDIAEALDLTVDEAVAFFAAFPAIQRKLETLQDVGLGYIRLGQPAPTLSGGEAQRIKLSRELGKRATGHTLYLLDEPTTGLHAADVAQLLLVLERLVDAGNTVAVIEHHPDVVKSADWIIDLGPEGGEGGGRVVAEGTPEQVAQVKASYTGAFLRPLLYGDGDGPVG
jgi:excinuclease ABC subunit A